MKYFFVFLLLINTCFAQKIVVRDESGNALKNVSIFLVEKENSLLAITNNLGEAQLSIEKNAKYLFHLVGYSDKSINGTELEKNTSIELKEFINHLEEITIGLKRAKAIKIISRQSGFNWGFPNSFRVVIDKVVPIEIKQEGFLKKFTLSLAGNSSHNTRVFRFLLYENIDGMPGRLFVEEEVEGKIFKNQMIFDLTKLYLLLKNGNYFIGFETVSNGAFDQQEAKEAKKNKGWISASTQIKSKYLAESISYIRRNLGNWEKDNGNIQGSQMYINMAYELEMDIVN